MLITALYYQAQAKEHKWLNKGTDLVCYLYKCNIMVFSKAEGMGRRARLARAMLTMLTTLEMDRVSSMTVLLFFSKDCVSAISPALGQGPL